MNKIKAIKAPAMKELFGDLFCSPGRVRIRTDKSPLPDQRTTPAIGEHIIMPRRYWEFTP